MNIQRSFSQDDKGTLQVVPTPIGNLEDITYRAVRVLKESSVIAAEDTRNTQKLLNHFNIKTPLISYHEHNKKSRQKEILKKLAQGEQIALVSDAGMPAISDPGSHLIQKLIEENYAVIVLPGANAALCAVVGSGLSTSEFLFYGFLPRKKKDQEGELERLKSLPSTMIFYESPYRIKTTLQAILKQFGDRKIAIARELTKRYEEYLRGSISQVLEVLDDREPRGEFCLVVEGGSDGTREQKSLWWSHLSVINHVKHHIYEGNLSNRDAIKKVALERDLRRQEVYRIFHANKN